MHTVGLNRTPNLSHALPWDHLKNFITSLKQTAVNMLKKVLSLYLPNVLSGKSLVLTCYSVCFFPGVHWLQGLLVEYGVFYL